MAQLESLFEVTAVQSGTRFKINSHGGVWMLTVANDVTVGGVMLLQSSTDGSAWTTRATRTVTDNGTFMDLYSVPGGVVIWARCRLNSRTDGTFSGYLVKHRGNDLTVSV